MKEAEYKITYGRWSKNKDNTHARDMHYGLATLYWTSDFECYITPANKLLEKDEAITYIKKLHIAMGGKELNA